MKEKSGFVFIMTLFVFLMAPLIETIYKEVKKPDGSSLAPRRLCRKSAHGSTGSPRTDGTPWKNKHLAVRPEPVEG